MRSDEVRRQLILLDEDHDMDDLDALEDCDPWRIRDDPWDEEIWLDMREQLGHAPLRRGIL